MMGIRELGIRSPFPRLAGLKSGIVPKRVSNTTATGVGVQYKHVICTSRASTIEVEIDNRQTHCGARMMCGYVGTPYALEGNRKP